MPTTPTRTPATHNAWSILNDDKQRRYAKTEPLYQRANVIVDEALWPNHSNVVISLQDLANRYRTTNRAAKAEALEDRTT